MLQKKNTMSEQLHSKGISNRVYIWLFGLSTLAYIIGLFTDIMDVDASQYASISREMAVSHSYLIVKHRLHDYLDKPPLLFWLSTLSLKLFGLCNWAYKLPSFLSSMLGAYATYRLGCILYNRNTGRLAALFLYCCEAYFLFNNDVRTDTLLANFVIVCLWQLIAYIEFKKWHHWFFGFTAMAAAMLAKGPIGAVIPAFALGTHLLYTRNWKTIFKVEWLAGALWLLVLLSPMLWGLYLQYGTEGIRFFFWTQSFGRITGENVWKNDSGYFFFVHTFLWSFLPWSFFTFVAIFQALKHLIVTKAERRNPGELYTLGGFLLGFVALSFSHYKLPHYIYVIFPLGALFTAAFVEENKNNNAFLKFFTILQAFVVTVMWTGLTILCGWAFPGLSWSLLILTIVLLGSVIYFNIKGSNALSKLILPSALTMIATAFLLNGHLYPYLLKYQCGKPIAKAINEMKIPKKDIYAGWMSHSLEFYHGDILPNVSPDEFADTLRRKGHAWLVADEDFKKRMEEKMVVPLHVYTFNEFSVTRLKLKFINPETRGDLLEKRYLIQY